MTKTIPRCIFEQRGEREYIAVGKHKAFTISWHYGKKRVCVLVEDLHRGKMLKPIVPTTAVIYLIQNFHIFFSGNGKVTGWEQAIQYVKDHYDFEPMLKGINYEPRKTNGS